MHVLKLKHGTHWSSQPILTEAHDFIRPKYYGINRKGRARIVFFFLSEQEHFQANKNFHKTDFTIQNLSLLFLNAFFMRPRGKCCLPTSVQLHAFFLSISFKKYLT